MHVVEYNFIAGVGLMLYLKCNHETLLILYNAL